MDRECKRPRPTRLDPVLQSPVIPTAHTSELYPDALWKIMNSDRAESPPKHTTRSIHDSCTRPKQASSSPRAHPEKASSTVRTLDRSRECDSSGAVLSPWRQTTRDGLLLVPAPYLDPSRAGSDENRESRASRVLRDKKHSLIRYFIEKPSRGQSLDLHGREGQRKCSCWIWTKRKWKIRTCGPRLH